MAKVIKVSSPGNNNDIQPLFQAAINSAVNGDTVELPAGQFVLNKNVTVTKFISIKGQGLSSTVLYRSETTSDSTLSNDSAWRGMIRYNINSSVSSGIMVSDLTLKSKKPSMVNGDGLSVAADIGIEMVKCIDFVITRCHFENFGNGAVSVTHDDNQASGLIYKNEFVHNAKGYDALGLGYGVVVYGTNTKWVDDPKFGSNNFIFVEDNTFDYHRHSIAAGGAALYVFRYNTVKNNIAGNTAHAIDGHEANLEKGSQNYYSTRAMEIYNNNIVNTMFKDGTSNVANGTAIVAGKSPGWLTECAIRPRGGEALIYNNYIEGYRFGVGLVNADATATYPTPYQQGYLSGLKYGANHTGFDGDKGNGDVFIWNNKYKSYAPTNSQCVEFWNYSSGSIKLNRDYHLVAKPNYSAFTYPHPLAKSVIVYPKLEVSISATSVSCNGGKDASAVAIVKGGNPISGYTYIWNTQQKTSVITKLSAGTYSVIVSDGTSTAITTTIVIEPKPLTALATVTIQPDGGVGPYTYLWSDGQTTQTAINLSAVTYSVSITDKNGCVKKMSVRIR